MVMSNPLIVEDRVLPAGVESMRSIAKSFGWALGLTFLMGAVAVGCGSSRAPGGALSTRGDADVPASVAQQLRACAEEHKMHLGQAQHALHFEVHLGKEGQVDSVSLEDSTLEDQGLEACMANALRSLSMDEIPLRGSERGSHGLSAPESRELLGLEHVLLCLASPPCVLALTLLVGATFLTVQIFVYASSQSAMAKPESFTAPIVTAMPTTTAIPVKSKNECVDFYVRCTDEIPKAPCGDCIHKCTTQMAWPRDLCPL